MKLGMIQDVPAMKNCRGQNLHYRSWRRAFKKLHKRQARRYGHKEVQRQLADTAMLLTALALEIECIEDVAGFEATNAAKKAACRAEIERFMDEEDETLWMSWWL